METAKPVSFLDHAKFRYGGSYHDHSVDDIKKVGKVLLVFLALVPYWMVYYQVGVYTLWSYYYGNFGFVTHSGVIVKLPSNKG